jgi:hypothetical protein
MSGAEFIRVNRYGNPVATCTAVVRTARQKSIGGYRPELPHSGDMEMWMRFAAHGPVARVKAYQGVYRRHARNMSNAYYGNNILQDLRQRKAAIDLVFDNDGNRMEHAEDLRRYLYEGLAEAAVCYADKHFNQVDLKRFDEMLEFAARIRTEAARVAEIVRKDAELNALRKEVGRLVEQLTGLTAMHMTLLRSTSWRLTAPLRNFGTALPWLRTPLRRAARLAWWTVTLQAPRRLTERRSALASAAGTARGQRSAIAPAGPRPKEAPAFDRDWYPSSYPDVAAAGIDPYKHYMAHGKGEGRHPTSAAADEANRQPRSTGGSVSN